MLVGITGKLGSGKDYVANNIVIPIIKNKYRYLQWSFADQLKINVMTNKYIDYKTIYEEKTADTRTLLQDEGTRVGRDKNKNIWINFFQNWTTVHNKRGIDVFVITDVRFKNEMEYIKKMGGILIKVWAPNRNLERLNTESKNCDYTKRFIETHESECDLDMILDTEYDMVIDNDSPSTQKHTIELQRRFIDIFYKKYGIENTIVQNRELVLSDYIS